MRSKWLLLVLLLCLPGCATFDTLMGGGEERTPFDNVEVSATKSMTMFSDNARTSEPLADHLQPIPLPPLPKATVVADADGKEHAAFTADGMNQLIYYKDVSASNTQLAKDLVGVANSAINQKNAVVEAGKLEERRANHNAEKLALTEEELKRTKRKAWFSRWGYRAATLAAFILGLKL